MKKILIGIVIICTVLFGIGHCLESDNILDKDVVLLTKNLGTKAIVGFNRWFKLKNKDKLMVVMHPYKTYKTYKVSKMASKYTEEKFGTNGFGDKSDAFRHAMWGALLCKNIDVEWSKKITKAHENIEKETEIAKDGVSEKRHKEMDIFNNNVGIECWEYELKNSNGEDITDDMLMERVMEKIKNGEVKLIHQEMWVQ